jgi:hypothetical protein
MKRTYRGKRAHVRFRGEADMHRRLAATASVVNDPGCVKTPCFM